METCQRVQTTYFCKRLQPTGFNGLEIWSGEVEGTALFQSSTEQFPWLLGRFLLDLWSGSASFSKPPDRESLAACQGFDSLSLVGGGALQRDLFEVLGAFSFPFRYQMERNPQFAGVRGLSRMAQKHSLRTPLLIDWGQTALKVGFCERVSLIPRQHIQFPLDRHSLDVEEARDRLRCLFLSILGETEGRADGVFIGLPIELSDDASTGGCSYLGLRGDIESLFHVPGLPVYFMNDAVAAAYGTAAPTSGRVLVISIGFGLGGCLVTPPF